MIDNGKIETKGGKFTGDMLKYYLTRFNAKNNNVKNYNIRSIISKKNLIDFIDNFNKNNENKLYVFKILNDEQSYKDFSIFYFKYALEKKLLSKLPKKNHTEKNTKI